MHGLTIPNDVISAPALGLALSGGGDSMALLHKLSTAFPDKTIHALTVDHGLRDNSAAEAASLTPWLANFKNVKHIILRWEGDKPQTALMQSARNARYALMAAYCHAHNIKILAIAHHGDDQRETLLMRLARASGLDGLSAMRPYAPYDAQLNLWRPLLASSHAALIAYCQTHALNWVEDPTNHNTNYERPRMRALGEALDAEGIDANAVARSTARLARAADALEMLTTRLQNAALLAQTPNSLTYNMALIRAEPEELLIRLLRRALKTLGTQENYGARYDKVEDLAHTVLTTKKHHKTTLAGCVIAISPAKNTLEITRENAA